MKKVRFETPDKFNTMNDNECHSPRPFMERQVHADEPNIYNYPKLLTYNSDPVQRFECSNSSPYPMMNRTSLPPFEKKSPWLPSNDLELSMLDSSHHEPRKPIFSRSIPNVANIRNTFSNEQPQFQQKVHPQVLTSIDNKVDTPPNVLNRHNDFFIRRDNIQKLHLDVNPIQNFNKLSLDKENNPIVKKAELMKSTLNMISPEVFYNHTQPAVPDNPVQNNYCQCHHCVKIDKNVCSISNMRQEYVPTQMVSNTVGVTCNQYNCMTPPQQRGCSHCNQHISPVRQPTDKPFSCNSVHDSKPPPQNAVDKKTWAIQRYEDSKKSDCMEVEKQTNVSKEKREPTVSDLFKIIKLQNEQLKLLQEKVDKFISASKIEQNQPPQDYRNHVIQTVNNEQISIGVMTSFEMVRTSTVINKEMMKANEKQIQCNRSQISIKGVVAKTQPVNLNFLDGIKRISQEVPVENGNAAQMETMYDEKTLNEQSLYNLQVDNATTPMMSPEQSLYLDVRDYSDSESGSDSSNVGWTYYNKVMTHVNGVLEESDMPSSASALHRNAQQQCMQMQIDKTNVSVAKRVKFGDDPFGIHQPHIYAASTDTSLKMNQLAAKYLKNGPPTVMSHPPAPKPSSAPIDMSFATRNYMEKHKLLQGGQQYSRLPGELPRFLDITALKKQPKLL